MFHDIAYLLYIYIQFTIGPAKNNRINTVIQPSLKSNPLTVNITVYEQGNWYQTCVNSFNLSIANVICQQQGFGRAISYSTNMSPSFMNNMMKVGNIDCSGYEMKLIQCHYQPITNSNGNCSWLNEVTVNCDTCKLWLQISN